LFKLTPPKTNNCKTTLQGGQLTQAHGASKQQTTTQCYKWLNLQNVVAVTKDATQCQRYQTDLIMIVSKPKHAQASAYALAGIRVQKQVTIVWNHCAHHGANSMQTFPFVLAVFVLSKPKPHCS
jgi:hypothetical protein